MSSSSTIAQLLASEILLLKELKSANTSNGLVLIQDTISTSNAVLIHYLLKEIYNVSAAASTGNLKEATSNEHGNSLKVLVLGSLSYNHYSTIALKQGFPFISKKHDASSLSNANAWCNVKDISLATVSQLLQELNSILPPSQEGKQTKLIILIQDLTCISHTTSLAEYMELIYFLQSKCQQLIVGIHPDSLSSVSGDEGNGGSEGASHSLLTWLKYQSRLLVNVLPLSAGWTEGVDGQIEITRREGNGVQTPNSSYLYQANDKSIEFRNLAR